MLSGRSPSESYLCPSLHIKRETPCYLSVFVGSVDLCTAEDFEKFGTMPQPRINLRHIRLHVVLAG